MPSPFPQNTELTAVLIAYMNPAFIADDVLPYVPVSSESFKWTEYTAEAYLALPDDRAGRTGALNTVQVQGIERSASVVDRGLKEPVPQRDVDAARANPAINPQAMATSRVAGYMANNREQRVANLVFSGASYAAANQLVLAGNSQWSDYVNSDPVDAILAGLDAMLMPATDLVFGQEVFTKLRQHPRVAKAVLGNAGDKTAATRAQLAELFGVQRVHVGSARGVTSKPGQPAVLSRLWGKHAAALYIDPNADTNGGMTFGFTARWGAPVAGSNAKMPGDMGLRGGEEIYAGQSIIELAVANQAGFFWQNAVA